MKLLLEALKQMPLDMTAKLQMNKNSLLLSFDGDETSIWWQQGLYTSEQYEISMSLAILTEIARRASKPRDILKDEK